MSLAFERGEDFERRFACEDNICRNDGEEISGSSGGGGGGDRNFLSASPSKQFSIDFDGKKRFLSREQPPPSGDPRCKTDSTRPRYRSKISYYNLKVRGLFLGSGMCR